MLPIVRERWHGTWVVPDLRGHGRSGHRAPYSYGAYASDIASLLPQDEKVTVIGHSMGGVVALALATGWYGVKVKVRRLWHQDPLDRRRGREAAPTCPDASALVRHADRGDRPLPQSLRPDWLGRGRRQRGGKRSGRGGRALQARVRSVDQRGDRAHAWQISRQPPEYRSGWQPEARIPWSRPPT